MQRLVVWNELPIKSSENHLQVHVNGKDFLQFEHNPLLLILKLMMHMQLVCMHGSSHCIWVKTALKPYDDVSAETVVAMLESYNKS